MTIGRRDAAGGGVETRFLAAYDAQLRTDAEMTNALVTSEHGPLRLAVFPGGRGFVSYAHLDGSDADEIGGYVDAAQAYFRDVPDVAEVEWKTRGHDRAPGLHDALTSRGFVAEEPESIMIGEASSLALDLPVPDGVEVRRVRSETEVREMEEMQGDVFDDPDWHARAEDSARRFREGDDVEFWVAVADGRVISAGRLEPVDGTEFAGLWGGATVPEWRGRGVYRALTAGRARAALSRGKRFLHSDSTEFSRPILERSGLVKVGTTTPYVWNPAGG